MSFIQDNTVVRFKLWDDPLAILFYPVYDGDVLGPDAKFEVWSLNTTGVPTLGADKSFDSSVLVFQTVQCTSCCSNPDVDQVLIPGTPTQILPYNYCNPFCELLVIP